MKIYKTEVKHGENLLTWLRKRAILFLPMRRQRSVWKMPGSCSRRRKCTVNAISWFERD